MNNFKDKIMQLEEDLEKIHLQNIKQFPNQPKQQAAVFLDAMTKKIKQLLEEIPAENRENFQNHIKKTLNLKDKSDLEDFALSAPKQIDYLIKSGFKIN
jgi:hypothetical protein